MVVETKKKKIKYYWNVLTKLDISTNFPLNDINYLLKDAS
jgi:hypothetical protein